MKKLITSLLAAGVLAFGSAPLFAASDAAPQSVIHVVTVSWKKDATPEQIKAALDGAHQMPQSFKGLKRVWTKTIKSQHPDNKQVIVMEFENEQALKDYAGSDAQKAWYKAYTPIRERSMTFDITSDRSLTLMRKKAGPRARLFRQ